MKKDDFAALVPDAVQRREALALFQALVAAEDAPEPNKAAVNAAEKAWQDHPTPDFERGHDDAPVLCALSGLPVFEDDAVLHDGQTDETVLKVCLGVPLDPENDSAFLLDDDEPAAAEAA